LYAELHSGLARRLPSTYLHPVLFPQMIWFSSIVN
jgi:hypothetical protein